MGLFPKELSVEEKEWKERAKICKGQVFRARETMYEQPSNGGYVYKVEMIPLKRKSCPGCSKCEWMYEAVSDAISGGYLMLPRIIEDKGLYTVAITNESRDWESGIVDDYDVEFIEWREND